MLWLCSIMEVRETPGGRKTNVRGLGWLSSIQGEANSAWQSQSSAGSKYWVDAEFKAGKFTGGHWLDLVTRAECCTCSWVSLLA